jgi:hypothetical protein
MNLLEAEARRGTHWLRRGPPIGGAATSATTPLIPLRSPKAHLTSLTVLLHQRRRTARRSEPRRAGGPRGPRTSVVGEEQSTSVVQRSDTAPRRHEPRPRSSNQPGESPASALAVLLMSPTRHLDPH